MAEAAAGPLAIAGAQGSWFVVQKLRRFRPKCRLQKWEDKVARALEGVQKQHSIIKQSEMMELMQAHTMY